MAVFLLFSANISGFYMQRNVLGFWNLCFCNSYTQKIICFQNPERISLPCRVEGMLWLRGLPQPWLRA